MPTLHIVTVGTSLLSNSGWQNGTKLPSRKSLLEKLQSRPRELSAELNALMPFIQKGECSSVHLIATDTPEGRLCRDTIATFLQRQRVHLTRAEARGLLRISPDQAASPQSFYQSIRQFRELVLRVVQSAKRRGDRVLVNTTGGLKAQTAVAALVAAEFGLEAYYIHQSLCEPVYLPTAALDESLLALLRELDRHGRGCPAGRLREPDRLRLEREGLIHVSRDAEGQPRHVTLTDYAKHLLSRSSYSSQG